MAQVQITVKSHYSASELAAMRLPGLPATIPGIRKRANNEQWGFFEDEGFGGTRREYTPPPAVMDLIRVQAANRLAATAPVVVPAAVTVQQPATETQAQAQVADARRGVIIAMERLMQHSGYTQKKACAMLIDMARVGTANPQLVAMLRLARDGRGRKSADGLPSVRSLQRFVEQEKAGRLAPQPTREKDLSIPAWALMFLACYQVPTKPAVEHAYRQFLPLWTAQHPDAEVPSVHQVRRFLAKVGNISRLQGRMGPRELKTKLPFIRRDFSKLLPSDIYSADGHTFDAEVQNPLSGRPFRPEITSVVDIATRKLVGWSVGLAESALAVLDAVRHACLNAGIPAEFYVDNGSGYKNQMMNDQATGLMGRLGITMVHSAPYSSQARGVIERLHQTVWVAAAKELPGYMGWDMDREAKLQTFKVSRKAIQKGTVPMPLLAWTQFVDFCNEKVAQYNDAPHRSLEKITDPVTGRRRHMSPNERWAQFEAQGFTPVQVADDEARPLFRPQELRVVQRGEVSLFNNIYFSDLLTEFHGDTLAVAYDVHDASQVWLYDDQGRLVCTAEWNANKRDYRPKSRVDQAQDKRADAALGRLDVKRDSIEAERRGVPVLEMDTGPISMPGFMTINREELAQRAREIDWAQPVDTAQTVVLEAAVTPEAVAKPEWIAPSTPQDRWELFLRLQGLDDSELEYEKQKIWRITYPMSAEFRAFQRKTA